MTTHPHSEEELLAQRGGEIVREAALSISAPLSLRERLEYDREHARTSRRRRGWAAGALTGLAAIIALLVLLAAPGGTPAGPTVVQAAALGMRPATGPAPARNATARDYVQIHEGHVRFPYWADATQWRSAGVRRDSLAGHHVTTVFYDAPSGARVAYTVVATPALRIPAGTPAGRGYVVLHRTGHTIVTWREHGQTCIVSVRSSVMSDRDLVALAEHDADV